MSETRTDNPKVHSCGIDAVYRERNRLVAVLASIYPSSLELHEASTEDENWDPEWMWVCIIDTPQGQCSWHLHEADLPLFDHVPRRQGRKWDGTCREEKYSRLERLCTDKETEALHEVELVMHRLATGG